ADGDVRSVRKICASGRGGCEALRGGLIRGGMDKGPLHEVALVDARTRPGCSHHQRGVQIAARDSSAVHPVVPALDANTVVAGKDPSVERGGCSGRTAEAKTPKNGQRPRIQAVAAQLGSGEPCAIEHQHARPAARKNRRGESAGGSGARDENVNPFYSLRRGSTPSACQPSLIARAAVLRHLAAQSAFSGAPESPIASRQ